MSAEKPLYSQIQDYIVQQIENGHWAPHQQIPPEREIATQFQVSRITAKNAMTGLVNSGYLYRHRGKGTFVAARDNGQPAPQLTAAASTSPLPVQQTKRMIGFILPWMEFNYSSHLISGIEAALTRLSYHFIFKRIANREEESQAIHDFLHLPVDGFIIAASQGEQHFNDEIVRLILDKHPVVMVERTMRDIQTNGVYCNTKEIGELMVDYLLKQQVKNIGLVTYPSLYTIGVSDRINGFQNALLHKGLEPLSESYILSVSPSILEVMPADTIPEEIVAFIKQHRHLEAIATVDALLARYVGMACAMLGMHHMKIISCDQPTFQPDCVYPVAYIDQSPYEMGTIAAEMIVDTIENQTAPRKHKITPKLVELSR
ncbi:GntR family transcriptional regulator [Paenibacillus sp. GCM10027626]|uniref:GntR family transcriptional regulator n=1 Tax=Paenibacillus sp. GCM10027626 TaxID=3273411 RepID=UPI003627CA26